MISMKPQLAEDADLETLRYPVWAQPKIDGVRGLNLTGVFTGRSMDCFEGYGITEFFSKPDFLGLDGELILGNIPNAKGRLCSLTTGAVGRFKGVTEMADFTWRVFDYITPHTVGWEYAKRYEALERHLRSLNHPRLFIVPYEEVTTPERMKQVIHQHLMAHYEGTITRNPNAKYKEGRSTKEEQQLLRIKLWVDFEMLVTGITEGAKNTNAAKINTLGKTERSSAKAGKVPNGQVGSLQGTLLADVKHPITGEVIFKKGLPVTMAPGEMTTAEAVAYFQHPETIIGHIAKGKCMVHGSKDVPRFPIFQTLRLPQDMS